MASTSGGAKKATASKNSSSAAKSSTAAKKPAASRSGSRSAKNAPKPIRREVGAVVCLFLAIFSAIGYFNVDALFIDIFCGFLKGLVGWGFYLIPPALLMCAVTLGFHRGRPVVLRVTATALLPIVFGAIADLLFARTGLSFDGSFLELCGDLYRNGSNMAGGGLVSGLLSMALEAMFSIYGALPVLLAAFIFLFMAAAHLSFAKISSWRSSRERAQYVPEPEPEASAVNARSKRARRQAIDIPMDDEPTEADYERGSAAPARQKKAAANPPAEHRAAFDIPMPGDDEPWDGELDAASIPERRESAGAPGYESPRTETFSDPAPKVETFAAPEPPKEAPQPKIEFMPPIEEDSEDGQDGGEDVAEALERAKGSTPEYTLPPLDLLRKGSAAAVDGRDEIALNRERLEASLKSFGVAANIVGATRGPTVTRYDLELESGVKLTKLTNLSSDLALSLGVMNVRIAPIPDKISTVGIEVPNKIVSIVYLREVIESAEFQNAKSSLTFAIGKDISGRCVVGNIAKLPHMLIAGTTGSGKSVCLNSLLLSLLYKSTPEQVRLIMVDPKMVELGIYNGIPHLLVPVVTDPKKAAGALQWAVVEMLKRYRLFSEAGVRDLAGYNAHQKKLGEETMAQVVIVVDELADLMLVASKDVEESICRVAQMGRAAGMHLIIATQRPSADVITGLMKANIPSRIAFAVSSAMESRIILDASGAEKLIGMGDMLYFPLGSGKPMRVQGAYVSDEEREDVINYIKGSSRAEYSDDVLAQIEKAATEKDKNGKDKPSVEPDEPSSGAGNAFAAYDELLPQAVDVIFETKQASVSMLQRRLKLGYSRAARLVDQMEELGIVGPFEGSKPRQVLITKQQWQEMQLVNGTAPTERFKTEMEFGTDGDGDDNPPF